MKLSKKYKESIVKEFDHVLQKMKESDNPDEILYYLSGIQTHLQRVLNFEYSKDLLFAWFIIDRVYQDIYGLSLMIKKGEMIPTFKEDFADKLIEALTKIKDSFFKKDDRVGALNDYVELMYSCTGNGFYLSSKGIINPPSDTPKLKDSK